MSYTITDKCDKAGACIAVCPVSAISEGESQYVIDPDLCIDCGACEAVCPMTAIVAP
jgi:NAD-dependent dihydropyrimidine dehydrogenase PreA subunit